MPSDAPTDDTDAVATSAAAANALFIGATNLAAKRIAVDGAGVAEPVAVEDGVRVAVTVGVPVREAVAVAGSLLLVEGAGETDGVASKDKEGCKSKGR